MNILLLVTSSLKACVKAWQLSCCFWGRTVNGGSIFADDTELKKYYLLLKIYFYYYVGTKAQEGMPLFRQKAQRCCHEKEYF